MCLLFNSFYFSSEANEFVFPFEIKNLSSKVDISSRQINYKQNKKLNTYYYQSSS